MAGRTISGTTPTYPRAAIRFRQLAIFVTSAATYLSGEYAIITDDEGEFTITVPVPDTGTIPYLILLPDGSAAAVFLGDGPATTLEILLASSFASGSVDQDVIQTAIDAHALIMASTSILGHVKIDGTTITIDGDGVISGAAGTPTGPAGGVLSGTYPDPSFAVDMATQAELNSEAGTRATADSTLQTNITSEAGARASADSTHAALTTAAHGGIVASTDLRLTDSRAPTGAAGGVLSGTYPDPGFAVDMATQAELDSEASTRSTDDSTLATAISTEAGTRATADSTLQTNITSEAGTRATADTTLQTNIDGKQPLDSDLTAIALLSTTSYGRSLLEAATAAALRTLAGVVIGTDVQALDAELSALAGLTSAADKGIQFTGVGTAATFDLTTAGKALLDDATNTIQRTTLGLGTAAIADKVAAGAAGVLDATDPTTTDSRAPTAHVHPEGDVTNLVADLALRAPLAGPTFTGVPAAPTAAPGTNTTQLATTAFAQAAIAALVASSPATLDTLNELALALGSDPNFATTITALIGTKQPLDSDLTAIAALSTTAFGRALLALVDASALTALLGSGSAVVGNFLGGDSAWRGPLGSKILTVNANGGAQYTTIAAALAAAVSGDVVLVMPGVYIGAITIPSGVSVIGLSADPVQVTIQDDAISPVVTMEGGKLANVYVTTDSLAPYTLIECTTGSNGITNCLLYAWGSDTNVDHIGIKTSGSAGCSIRACRITLEDGYNSAGTSSRKIYGVYHGSTGFTSVSRTEIDIYELTSDPIIYCVYNAGAGGTGNVNTNACWLITWPIVYANAYAKYMAGGFGLIVDTLYIGQLFGIVPSQEVVHATGTLATFRSPIWQAALATEKVAQMRGAASQSANIHEWQDSSGNPLSTISENGYFTTRKNAAPADGELATGELALWFDSTAGAAKLMIKAKNASGTVVTGNVALA